MSSTEMPFSPDDALAGGRPAAAGHGWAQRERLSGQLRSVRRWIIVGGVAATALFSWLAVHQTTSLAAGVTGAAGAGTTQSSSLPPNAPSQSLFTQGASGGSGFSAAPAPSQGGAMFRTATS